MTNDAMTQKPSTPVAQPKPSTPMERLCGSAKKAWARVEYVLEDWELRQAIGRTKAQEDEYKKAMDELRAFDDGGERGKRLREIAKGFGELAQELEDAQKRFKAAYPHTRPLPPLNHSKKLG